MKVGAGPPCVQLWPRPLSSTLDSIQEGAELVARPGATLLAFRHHLARPFLDTQPWPMGRQGHVQEGVFFLWDRSFSTSLWVSLLTATQPLRHKPQAPVFLHLWFHPAREPEWAEDWTGGCWKGREVESRAKGN